MSEHSNWGAYGDSEKRSLPLWAKITFTVTLAVIVWSLFGCHCSHHDRWVDMPAATDGVTDQHYLESLYMADNDAYFRNRLLHTTEIITFNDPDVRKIAYTQCNDEVTACTMNFNLAYSSAARVAATYMLHEQCHIKTWGKDKDDHGKTWRGCMAQLDAEGAFREILIDNYSEDL